MFAFVLADRDLKVLTANAAFVELAEMPSVDRVVGAHLGQWLGRPGIDLDLIVGQLREHGSVRNLATILRGAAGAQEDALDEAGLLELAVEVFHLLDGVLGAFELPVLGVLQQLQ